MKLIEHFWKVFAVVTLGLAAYCVYVMSPAPEVKLRQHNQRILNIVGAQGDTAATVYLKGSSVPMTCRFFDISDRFILVYQDIHSESRQDLVAIPVENVEFLRVGLKTFYCPD